MVKEFSMYNKSLNDLKKAVNKNKKLMISYVWSDLKDYKEIESFLLSNDFRIIYKKPVF
jgi:hypothetical protein